MIGRRKAEPERGTIVLGPNGQKLDYVTYDPPADDPDPRDAHQQAILAAYQEAVRLSEETRETLALVEGKAARAATALVEARRRLRRVAEGSI